MDPVTASLIMGGTNVVADLINSAIRDGRLTEARRLLSELPIPEEDKYAYDAVLMDDPQKLVPILQGDTRLASITEDPMLKDAQMGALEQLQQVGREGYTIQDKAAINRAMQESLNAQRGANMAQDAQMQRRGITGSGIDLMNRLARSQAGIQSANQAGLDIAAQGRARALQAMQSAGQLGGQIRGQEWGQKSQVASAADAINAANVANRMNTQQQNVSNAMAASQFNAGTKNQAEQFRQQGDQAIDQMGVDRDTNIANTWMV